MADLVGSRIGQNPSLVIKSCTKKLGLSVFMLRREKNILEQKTFLGRNLLMGPVGSSAESKPFFEGIAPWAF